MEPEAPSAERIGKYELVQRVALGGMAEIFLARQRGPSGFERPLVVKRILPALAADPQFLEMFLDEARLAAQLIHPNIAQVYDFGCEQGQYFIAMELVRGPDLRKLLGAAQRCRLPLPFPIAAHIIAGACAALDYAHACVDDLGRPLGVIHRDVSPGNILVSREGAAKLVDFGIAKAAASAHLTRTGILKGKVSFMAPEQLEGRTVDGRADLFALGAVLFELCTSRRAFEGASDPEIIRAICDRDLPDPRRVRNDVPHSLARVIARAIERDVERRYASARRFFDDLTDYLESVPGRSTTAFVVAEYLRDLDDRAGGALLDPRRALAAAGGSPSPATPAPSSPSRRSASALTPDAETAGPKAEATTVRPDTTAVPLVPGEESRPTALLAARTRPVRPRRLAAGLFAAAVGAAAAMVVVGRILSSGDEATPLPALPPTPPGSPGSSPEPAPVVTPSPTMSAVSPHRAGQQASKAAPAPPAPLSAAPLPPSPPALAPAPPRPAASPPRPAATASPEAPRPTRDTPESPVGISSARPAVVARPEVTRRVAAPAPEPPRAPPLLAGRARSSVPPGAAKRQADPPKLPAATTGFLTVETEPPTRIFLAGKMIGRTPLLRAEVPSGIWEVTARNEVEGVTTTWTISVATGAEVRRAVQFRMGKIAVRVRPYGEIFIDGKSFGVAPIPPVELYEGVRRVRVLGPEGTRPYDKQVEIRAGETTVVNIDLAR